ncbi:carbon-nitrogen hydrolase family protein [Streptomyces sp. NPDC004647]|uniref:carbon-nitrogen hydrolase family protein n=1 Tax=Streptomyces sp. NPDC004647 TaxID=3154671 RepID=UPI0033AB7F91
MRQKSLRLAMIQSQAYGGPEAPRMLDDGLGHVAEAARMKADIAVFPETSPGPVSWKHRYEVIEPMRQAAKRHGIDVVFGTTVKAPGGERAYHIAAVVIGRDGEIRGRYLRTHPGPANPEDPEGTQDPLANYYNGLYAGGAFWDFDFVPGHELPVFDMGWGKLGVGICSEVYVPEIARTYATRGADICVFPAGIMIDDLGFKDAWQTQAKARAGENVIYTATTVNLFDGPLRKKHVTKELKPLDLATGLNRGYAMIAAPDRVHGTLDGPGILTAELDLDYLRRKREEPEFPDGIKDLEAPPEFGSLPGTHNLHRSDSRIDYQLTRRG